MKELSLPTALALLTAGSASAQYCSPDLLSAFGGEVNNLVVDGSYVYAASQGFMVFDVSDPTSPLVVADIEAGATGEGIARDGDIVYMATERGGVPHSPDLLIIDVSTPTAPVVVKEADWFGRAFGLSYENGTVYLHSSRNQVKGIVAVDVTNPLAPTELSWLPLGVVGDSAVSNGVLYVTDDDSLSAYDVSDPATPTLLGTLPISPPALDLAVVGSEVLLAADVKLFVVDATSPSSMTLIGEASFPEPDLGGAYGVSRVGAAEGLAYLAGSSGAFAVSISDPSEPLVLGADTENPSTSATTGLAVAGDLVFVGDRRDGLNIYSVADPSAPSLIGSENPPHRAHDVAVFDDGIAVTNRSVPVPGSTLTVIGVSDPARPDALATLEPGWESTDVVAGPGSVAYVLTHEDGVQVLDLLDPLSPAFVGSLPLADIPHEAVVSADRLYVCADDQGLVIADISTPSTPTLLGSIVLPVPARDVFVDGDVAYVTGVAGQFTHMYLIDVSDPTAPSVLGSYTADVVGTLGSGSDVAVYQGYAYLADYQAGVYVFDVTDPTAPTIANLVTIDPEGADDLELADGVLYVSGASQVTSSVMRAYDLSDPTHPALLTTFDTPRLVRDLRVLDDVLYLADSAAGLVTYDVLGCDGPVCPADLAAPYGVLDFSDVLSFLVAFGSMDTAADLSPPIGVFDFSDVLEFLSVFGSGCP